MQYRMTKLQALNEYISEERLTKLVRAHYAKVQAINELLCQEGSFKLLKTCNENSKSEVEDILAQPELCDYDITPDDVQQLVLFAASWHKEASKQKQETESLNQDAPTTNLD